MLLVNSHLNCALLKSEQHASYNCCNAEQYTSHNKGCIKGRLGIRDKAEETEMIGLTEKGLRMALIKGISSFQR